MSGREERWRPGWQSNELRAEGGEREEGAQEREEAYESLGVYRWP